MDDYDLEEMLREEQEMALEMEEGQFDGQFEEAFEDNESSQLNSKEIFKNVTTPPFVAPKDSTIDTQPKAKPLEEEEEAAYVYRSKVTSRKR